MQTFDTSLEFRPPLRPDNLFGHLAATAVPGVEEVRDGAYRRTLRLEHGPAIAELRPQPDHVACRLHLHEARDRTEAVDRCRWLLDLDADPDIIDAHLAGDPDLRPLTESAPGRRVPRSADGAEMAIRAVLGQQISTAAARTHTARLAATYGEPVEDPEGGLTHLFPTPQALQKADLAMPAQRRQTMQALLTALTEDHLDLSKTADRERARAHLARLPGFGPWTREVIAMRALGDPDAFPATDLGARRGAQLLGLPATPAKLTARASRWRPWRAYALQHLWAATSHPINDWPPRTIERRS